MILTKNSIKLPEERKRNDNVMNAKLNRPIVNMKEAFFSL